MLRALSLLLASAALAACSSANDLETIVPPKDAGLVDVITVPRLDASLPDGGDASRPGSCAPFNSKACALSDGSVVEFPASSDALTTACTAYAKAESDGSLTTDGAPTITVPTADGVVSASTWAMFQWSDPNDASADASDATYVVVYRQGCEEVLRAVVQGVAWPVDEASWSRMIMAGPNGAFTMTVARVGDTMAVSAPVTFTLGP